MFGYHLIGSFFHRKDLTGNNACHFGSRWCQTCPGGCTHRYSRSYVVPVHWNSSHFGRGFWIYAGSVFPWCWFWRGNTEPWPQQLPDLTWLDFFFWGQFKSLICETRIFIGTHQPTVGEVRDMPGGFHSFRKPVLRHFSTCITTAGGLFFRKLMYLLIIVTSVILVFRIFFLDFNIMQPVACLRFVFDYALFMRNVCHHEYYRPLTILLLYTQ